MLKKVELADKTVIESFFNKNELIKYSAFNFSNIFIYREILNYQWCVFEDLLIIYSATENVFYLPIYKEQKLVEIDKFFRIDKILKEKYPNSRYLLVPEVFVKTYLKNLEHVLKIREEEKYFDYIYKTEALAELPGKGLHNKRNLIAQFERLYPSYTSSLLNEGDFDECFKLAELWCKIKSCEDIGFTHETSALKECFLNFKKLNFGGVKLILDNKIIAFCVFIRHRDDTFLVNFEKYNPDIKGASQMINKLTAIELLKSCSYLNREQDLGIEGLRKAKRSYLPSHMGKVFSLSL